MSRLTTTGTALPLGILLSACIAANGPGTGTGDDRAGSDDMPGAIMTCLFPEDDPGAPPIATIEHVLEVFEEQDAVHVRLTLDPDFVDNTYGDASIGWGNRGHWFKDIDKSDHAELTLLDGNGAVAAQFKIDYLSPDPAAPSGYSSLGVDGSDGMMMVGDRAAVLATRTSMDRNFNERGYGSYLEHSPVTDEVYTPDPAAPDWDFRYVFEAWVAVDAFGAAGFGDVSVSHIHASPAKTAEDTVIVEPDPCPPGWDPDCNDPDGCEGEPNPPGDPDCNDPDGCDGDPNDPGNQDPPAECVTDTDCPTGEFCNEGICSPNIG
jgi:Cys-rich repeat protein